MIGKGKKESKSSKQPAASQQYIYQYKIQYIIPNTFSNKESIAQEDSLHNQLKNFISYPLIVWGGGGVFLLEVQYSILKSLISTCVLSYVGSREDWLLDRICESKKDCWDSIRRTSYPYQ